MMRVLRWLPVLAALLALPACGNQKQAAERALGEAQAAWNAIAEQAGALAPDQAQAITAAFADAHAKQASGDWKNVLAAAADLKTRVQSLAEGLPALKAQLDEQWKSLTASVPGALAAAKRKLAAFGRPPAGMPGRERFDAASTQLAHLGQQWEGAQALATSGKLAMAVAQAGQVRDEAVKMLAEFQEGS